MGSGQLRIGVDARPLLHPMSGIGRYVYNLVIRLIESDHEWFLYSDRQLPVSFERYPNVTVRSGRVNSSVAGLIYSQVMFSSWAARDQVDIYWSTRHHSPYMLSSKIYNILSVYDLVWRRFPETMTRMGRLQEALLMPLAVRAADKVLAISHFTKSELVDVFPGVEDKVDVVGGASLLTLQNEKQSGGLVAERPYFLFVGTFEPRKNLTALLEAFRQYSTRAKNPIALKLVGGKGWGGVDVHKTLVRLGLVGQVDVLGNVQDEELGLLYKHAYALLMPSLYEGFGLPVVEALSFGTPVLISENSSLSEVAGEAGLTVNPYSSASIAEGLRRLSEDKGLRAELAKNAAKEASRYSWDRSSDKMRSLIASVAAATLDKV